MSVAPIARSPERICWTLSILTVLYHFASPLAAHRMELRTRSLFGPRFRRSTDAFARGGTELGFVLSHRSELWQNGQARVWQPPTRASIVFESIVPNVINFSEPLEIPSELPITRPVTLDVAEIETAVRVRDSAPVARHPNQSWMGTPAGQGRSSTRIAFPTLNRSTINACQQTARLASRS